MNIKYLKKFRKRFSWEFIDSGKYSVKLFDHKIKIVIDCFNTTEALVIIIGRTLGDTTANEFCRRKESNERLGKYNTALRLKNEKNRN